MNLGNAVRNRKTTLHRLKCRGQLSATFTKQSLTLSLLFQHYIHWIFLYNSSENSVLSFRACHQKNVHKVRTWFAFGPSQMCFNVTAEWLRLWSSAQVEQLENPRGLAEVLVCLLNSSWGFALHWFVVRSPKNNRTSQYLCSVLCVKIRWYGVLVICMLQQTMKTPGKEIPNKLVQDAEYIVFPSPHRKRHQRTGRFYGIQTEHTKSRDHCAFSQIGCLAQKPHYSTTDQICCLHAYKTDRNEQLQAIQVNCKTFLCHLLMCVILPVNVQKQWWGCHPALSPQHTSIKIFLSKKHTETGTWRLSSQRRVNKEPKLLMMSKLSFSQDSDP